MSAQTVTDEQMIAFCKAAALSVNEAQADMLLAIAARLAAGAETPKDDRHASAPEGYKCSDCTIDGEACPTCYQAAWRKRHPHTTFVAADPPTPEARWQLTLQDIQRRLGVDGMTALRVSDVLTDNSHKEPQP